MATVFLKGDRVRVVGYLNGQIDGKTGVVTGENPSGRSVRVDLDDTLHGMGWVFYPHELVKTEPLADKNGFEPGQKVRLTVKKNVYDGDLRVGMTGIVQEPDEHTSSHETVVDFSNTPEPDQHWFYYCTADEIEIVKENNVKFPVGSKVRAREYISYSHTPKGALGTIVAEADGWPNEPSEIYPALVQWDESRKFEGCDLTEVELVPETVPAPKSYGDVIETALTRFKKAGLIAGGQINATEERKAQRDVLRTLVPSLLTHPDAERILRALVDE